MNITSRKYKRIDRIVGIACLGFVVVFGITSFVVSKIEYDQYVKDYENNAQIETTTKSNGDVSIRKYYLSNKRLFEDIYENESGSGWYKYIWYNNNIYTAERYHEDLKGNWSRTVYEYNFKEDIKIETFTESNNDEVTVRKYSISTGQVIL